MRSFDRNDLARLLATHEEPCVSICLPTHRRFPECEQDPVKFRNLVRDAAAVLDKKYDRRDEKAKSVLERLERFAADGPDGDPAAFWRHQKEGLAVFAAPNLFSWFRVPIPLRDITVVSDSFHVKPLLPLLHAVGGYHVLALTRNQVKLFEGSLETVQEIELDGVPESLTAALGEELDTSRAGLSFHGSGGATGARHGAGRPSDEDKKELRRYFREVDRAVWEHHSKPSGRPLILAAVDYYHPLFHEVSKNPQLLEQGIPRDPKALSPEQLREAALGIFSELREQRLGQALEDYGTARAHGLGSDEAAELGSAAAAGRVKLLLLEEQRRIWGRVDRRTGEVAGGGQPGNPDDVDVLDDLAELVLSRGGDVLLVPKARMPTNAGLCAIFRF